MQLRFRQYYHTCAVPGRGRRTLNRMQRHEFKSIFAITSMPVQTLIKLRHSKCNEYSQDVQKGSDKHLTPKHAILLQQLIPTPRTQISAGPTTKVQYMDLSCTQEFPLYVYNSDSVDGYCEIVLQLSTLILSTW